MRYRRVSRLAEQDGAAQVDALIYCLGGDAEDILAASTLTKEEQENFEKVIDMLENHFIGKRNIIYERARFNQRRQEPGETVEAFVTALHRLVAHCGYGALKYEMVRDRLIVGLQDAKLSETLQSYPDLTLETAVQKARQTEAVRKQKAVVRQELLSGEASVDALRKAGKGAPPELLKQKRPSTQRKGHQGCSRCGGHEKHDRINCPASKTKCHSCGKKGHWEKMCRSKTLREVKEGAAPEQVWTLGALRINKTAEAWRKIIDVGGEQISFKIDTGADVSAVPAGSVTAVKTVTPTTTNYMAPGDSHSK